MNARGASVLGACVAWFLSAAPFALDAQTFAGLSRAALAAIPWIAYCGLPRALGDSGLRAVAFEIALFLPPLALGTWIDLAGGMARPEAASISGAALGFACGLSLSARLAARAAFVRDAHAVVWALFVVLAPVLAATLVLGGASTFGSAPTWLAHASSLSPLGWMCAQLAQDSGARATPFAPLVLVLVLTLIGFGARRASVRTEDE
ncbi:MAG: hypothetical protein JNL28_17705 [Planctomycetes bacterium]|nr:hypothetical protein [Planctomycetota bacterium]